VTLDDVAELDLQAAGQVEEWVSAFAIPFSRRD
jgi:hypothetical protein